MPFNHLVLCCPLLLLPSIFPSIRVFSNESALHIRWPKYWSFSFTISPSSEYSGLISFRIVWFDLLAVQGALMSLLQHYSSKASISHQNGPNSSPEQHLTSGHTTSASKLNELDHKVLPLLPCSPDLSPTDCHFMKHLDSFLQGKCFPQPAGGGKCFLRVSGIPKHGFLCCKDKQTNFLLTTIC